MAAFHKWKGPLKGNVTIGWWIKQRVNPGTGLSYLWGGIGSFRCFTNGVAGTGLWVRNWGGADIKFPSTTFQARARASNGVCVALTINHATNVGLQ